MKKHVLICEDDEGIIDVATIVLEDNGYTVSSTARGSEILNKISEKRPNIILLDLWMPEMTGDDVAKILKSKDIPVVFISASKDIASIAKSHKVTDFLPKPFDIMDLEKMVAKHIN